MDRREYLITCIIPLVMGILLGVLGVMVSGFNEDERRFIKDQARAKARRELLDEARLNGAGHWATHESGVTI